MSVYVSKGTSDGSVFLKVKARHCEKRKREGGFSGLRRGHAQEHILC